VEVEVNETTCATCGVVFGIAAHLEKQRREDGAAFHCSNGHVLVFNKGKSKAQLLQEEIDKLKADNTALKTEVDKLKKDLETTKAELETAKAPKREIHVDPDLEDTP